MVLECPCCHARFSAAAALLGEDGRRLIERLAKLGELGEDVLRYLELFRPAGRALGWSRAARLADDLIEDVQAARVRRRGVDRAAPRDLWRRGVAQLLARRDAGGLTLPLRSHGYLREVVWRLAEEAAARAERADEEARRRAGPRTGGGPQRIDPGRAADHIDRAWGAIGRRPRRERS